MEKLAGRLLIITLIVIVGLGFHVFNLQKKLDKAQATTAQAIQNRDDFRKRLDTANKTANEAQVALNTCTGSLKEAEEQLAAKGKKR